MNPPFASLLTATGISLISMVDPGLADSVGDTAEAADRVILEAGEIDSSTVPTGSYVVVIHGQGERHPVSGEWEQLFTSRGYVHAVGEDRLILVRRGDGNPELIGVGCIHKLVLVGSAPQWDVANSDLTELVFTEVANRDSASTIERTVGKLINGVFMGTPYEQTDSTVVILPKSVPCGRKMPDMFFEENGNSERVVGKLLAGAIAGMISGVPGAIVGFSIHDCPQDAWGCGFDGLFLGGGIGIILGTSCGVSWGDSHDQFLMALAGSLGGFGLGTAMTMLEEEFWPSLLIGPVVLATITSEASRSPEAGRFSVGLVPNPKKGLSAVATLHF